jgi:CDP-glucose 4,6-dehydratase
VIMSSDSLGIYGGEAVLITGDTGFKGSWLATWLIKQKANVIGYGLPPKRKEDNYRVCGLNDIYPHVDGDIRDLRSLEKVISEHRPSVIFHLAAQALVLDSLEDPPYTFETNIMGTVNVLEATRRSKDVRAVVNVTSDKCYENQEWPYGYRELDRLGGKDPYSASKGAAELVSSSYASTFFDKEADAAIATVRAGNVIGGGDWSPNRIVPDCIRALRGGRPIQLRSPDAVRPWQHVLDPLYGYLLVGAHLLEGDRRVAGPWNFGPHQRNMIPVKELVEAIIGQWGTGEYELGEPRPSKEAKFLHLDISKAINELGWYPILDFDRAVKQTVEEYRVDGRSHEEVYAQRVRHIEEYQRQLDDQRGYKNG